MRFIENKTAADALCNFIKHHTPNKDQLTNLDVQEQFQRAYPRVILDWNGLDGIMLTIDLTYEYTSIRWASKTRRIVEAITELASYRDVVEFAAKIETFMKNYKL